MAAQGKDKPYFFLIIFSHSFLFFPTHFWSKKISRNIQRNAEYQKKLK